MIEPSKASPVSQDTISVELEVEDAALLLRLSGPGASRLRKLGHEGGVEASLRGNTILLRGAEGSVHAMQRVIAELLGGLEYGELEEAELDRTARTLRADPELKLRELYDDVIVKTASRRIVAPKGPHQKQYVRKIRQQDIVFGIGPAGTGKTYIAMAMAVRALQEQRVKRIVLTRPAVEAGERLGFLPGDLAEKINPYLRPLYDALHDMMDVSRVSALMERGTIEVAPLAFMRGRTLNESFVVLDEAQNTTSEQMKMFLTRLGFESKAVITGDITQIDLPGDRRSGLRDAEAVLRGVPGIGFAYFDESDVVRHPLVQRIIQAYELRDANSDP